MISFHKKYTVMKAIVEHTLWNSYEMSDYDFISRWYKEFKNTEIDSVEWYKDYFEVVYKDYNK